MFIIQMIGTAILLIIMTVANVTIEMQNDALCSTLLEMIIMNVVNFLFFTVPDHQRPRVCSLPDRPYNPRQSDDLYRLRTFSISKGTVVNCGDSIISRRSRSNTSVNSTTSRWVKFNRIYINVRKENEKRKNKKKRVGRERIGMWKGQEDGDENTV